MFNHRFLIGQLSFASRKLTQFHYKINLIATSVYVRKCDSGVYIAELDCRGRFGRGGEGSSRLDAFSFYQAT